MQKQLLLLNKTLAFFFLCSMVLWACNSPKKDEGEKEVKGTVSDQDNGGIKLTEGFGAVVFADTVGKARHIVVRDNGDVYIGLSELNGGAGIVALRDTTNDGKADLIQRFGKYTGTGVAIGNGYLYHSPDSAIFRYKLTDGELLPDENFETIVSGLVSQRQHAAKSIALDGAGNVYVNIGAPSNACQNPDRTPGTKGQDPCPILETAGGIWKFPVDKLNQLQKDGSRYATGIRNAVAIDWNTTNNTLYILQHGRDQFNQFWPDLYTAQQSAELPAEEFFMVKEGSDFGWPYCYYDHVQNKKLLNPEYGGDGKKQGRCEGVEQPIMAFPAHWAPNDVLFYTGNMFPEKYKNGAFIAFHGSWNRSPFKQQGYFVAFVPFSGEKPSGDYEVFAENFMGADTIQSPADSKFRPVGLAQGPDGSLYISDSVKGRIWRVIYNGEKTASIKKKNSQTLARNEEN